MALPALAPEDEEEVAGAGPGVAPLAPPPVMQGMPQMPGVPAATPGAVPPDPNANLPPDALMRPGADLQPPAPTAPPPIPLTPDGKVDVAAAEKNALAEQGQLQAQGEGAERAKGAAETKIADAESTAADKQAAEAAQHAIDQQKVVDTANANTQKWLDQAQQDAQKYRGMGLHDYWADKSTGDKVLAGLSMLFGAAGKTQGGPENNPGMGMIERAVERDFRSQQANIEKARSNVAVDKEQVDLGMTAKQQALADSNLKKANAYDAAAAQLVSYKLKQGVPLAQANTDANVVALRQKGLAARQETLQAIHAQNIQDAHLAIEQQNADTLRLRAEKYKTRTGKGGGGAGGSARSQMAEAYSAWLEKNPNATEPEKVHQANAIGLPLTGKPSETTKKSVEDAFNAGGKAGIPQTLTDTLTGKDLPIDKNRTDAKKHNAAVAGLPQVNGAIQILDTVLKGADKPHAPQALSYLGMDTSAQANLIGEMTRFRSAYAASKKESVGEANAHELAEAIPDPPSALSSRANWENWKKKIEETRAELHESRNGLLANAGVKPQDFGGPADRPGAAPAGGGAKVGTVMPDGSVVAEQRNKVTGAIRKVLKRPDGSTIPVS